MAAEGHLHMYQQGVCKILGASSKFTPWCQDLWSCQACWELCPLLPWEDNYNTKLNLLNSLTWHMLDIHSKIHHTWVIILHLSDKVAWIAEQLMATDTDARSERELHFSINTFWRSVSERTCFILFLVSIQRQSNLPQATNLSLSMKVIAARKGRDMNETTHLTWIMQVKNNNRNRYHADR